MVEMVEVPNTLDLRSEKVCMKKQIKKAKKLLKKIQLRIEKKLLSTPIDFRDSGFYMKINEFRMHEKHLMNVIDILQFDEKSVQHFHIDLEQKLEIESQNK